MTCIDASCNPQPFGEGLLSIQAMAWAIQQQEVKEPITRFVLLMLCNHADPTGDSIFPSISRLSRETGLSERAIQYQIKKLRKSGLLVKTSRAVAEAKISRKDRVPNCYRVSLVTGCTPCTSLPERGAPDAATGCTPRHERGAPHAPDPSSYPSLNHKSVLQTVTREQREEFKKQVRALAQISMSPKRRGER